MDNDKRFPQTLLVISLAFIGFTGLALVLNLLQHHWAASIAGGFVFMAWVAFTVYLAHEITRTK